MKKNPLKAILNLDKKELPLALLMFGYFFLVITTFWILKPLKKTAFINFYEGGHFDLFGWQLSGPQAELIAKVGNMFVAYVAVIAFSVLARNLVRQQLTLVFAAFCGVCFVVFNFLLDGAGEATVWGFYFYGDLFNTLMVATFFAFLNDSVTPGAAKRMYGVVVLGGVGGGAFGTTVLRGWISVVTPAQWMWVCLGLTAAMAVFAVFAGRRVDRDPPPEGPSEPAAESTPKSKGNPALEGAKLALSSRYLLSVVAIVGIYEIVSTVVDFQFTSTITHYLSGDEIGKQFSTMYMITNWVSLLVQFFLTSLIMTRFGLTVALMVLPAMILGGSTVFLIFPVLWVGSFLTTVDNGFQYSVNQSAKEALYTITSREEKYKAKAFIDMFVQRFAKAIAVGVSLGITTIFSDFSSIRWLSLFTLIMLVLWVLAVRYAGNQFNAKTAEQAPPAG